MAGNLIFINETSTASATSLDLDDVFSADYDLYMIATSFNSSSENSSRLRVICSGSVQTTAIYGYSEIGLAGAFTYGSNRTDATSGFNNIDLVESDYGSTAISYIVNPYTSGTYTYLLSQSSGKWINGVTPSNIGYKYVGIWQGGTSVTGIQYSSIGGINTAMTIKVYGVSNG